MQNALDATTARAIVCDYMHYSGSCYRLLTNDQHMEVYVLADGFGPIGRRALAMHYDWSHVRDSSETAMQAMAAKITSIVNGASRKPRAVRVNLAVEVSADDTRSAQEIAQALLFQAIDGNALNDNGMRVDLTQVEEVS